MTRGLVINAGNKWKDLEHFDRVRREAFQGADLTIEHLEDHALIAVQGPHAERALQKLFKTKLDGVYFMHFVKEKVEWPFQAELTAYRTGYTGEDGFEVSMPNHVAVAFAEFLLSEGVTPAGLAARDALRLEAGLCLHGHDISEDTSPAEAQLQWTIRKEHAVTPFIGFEALEKIRAKPSDFRRVGFKLIDSGVAREGMLVLTIDEERLAQITSGGFSPTLKCGIGMAYLPASKVQKEGTEIKVAVRGKMLRARTTKMPFVPSKYHKVVTDEDEEKSKKSKRKSKTPE